MAVRRCLYGDGRAAHVLYRLDGEPVSLFIIPGLARPAAELSLFGHEQVVWTQGIGPTCWLRAAAAETTWRAWRLTSGMRQNRGMEEHDQTSVRRLRPNFDRRERPSNDRQREFEDADDRRGRDRDRAARHQHPVRVAGRTTTRTPPAATATVTPAASHEPAAGAGRRRFVHGEREAGELGLQVEGHGRQGSGARVVQGSEQGRCC